MSERTLTDGTPVPADESHRTMYYCDFCTRNFRTVVGLRTHALRMHPDETAPNRKPKCSRCGDTGWLDGDPVRGVSDEPCGCDENWEE